MNTCLSKLGKLVMMANKLNSAKLNSPKPQKKKKRGQKKRDCPEMKISEKKEDKSISIWRPQESMRESMKECQSFVAILNPRSLSPKKLSAIKNEGALSMKEFSKRNYIREHNECKETFKTIGGERNEWRKLKILVQALKHFTINSDRKLVQYFDKVESQCSTFEEKQLLADEKCNCLAERERWSTVKSSQNVLSYDDLIFAPPSNPNFDEFKKTLAASDQVSHPSTKERLQSSSKWKDNSMILTKKHTNEDVFPLQKAVLVENPNATVPKNTFTQKNRQA